MVKQLENFYEAKEPGKTDLEKIEEQWNEACRT
jgi:hypothetical protein